MIEHFLKWLGLVQLLDRNNEGLCIFKQGA